MKIVKNNRLTVSDYIINFFFQKGISHAFTVSGGGSIYLCDALYRSKNLKYIPCHHEQAVAFAAESYARFNNKCSFALVTTGPGGTNTITGVASSWIDSIPVFFISGQVFFNQTILKSKLRQKGVQESNIVDLVKPITKYAKTINDPNMIKYELEKAYYLSTNGRKGPVWLDIPANIQNALLDNYKLHSFNENEIKKNKSNHTKNPIVKKLAKKLLNSKKPLLFFGGGCKTSNAIEIALKIIKDFNIPFCLSWNGSDGFPNNLNEYVGKPGMFTQRYANIAVQCSDIFLSVGSRLNYGITGYNPKDFARNAYKVMVDIDENELKDAKKRISIDCTINRDAKLFLNDLYIELKNLKLRNDNKEYFTTWREHLNYLKNKFPILDLKKKDQKKYVNSYFFIDLLSNKLPKKTVIVTDMGLSFVCTNQTLITSKTTQRHYANTGHAPMGWGLPAAVGACFASNQKKVICITGDGGLQMNVQELATISHFKLPIIIFLYNNNGYSTIMQSQKLGFQSRIMGCNSESGLSFPNYSNLAKSYGISYTKIKSNNDIKNKLEKILKKNIPILCELMIHPDQPQEPKMINRRTEDNDIAIPSKFEDLYPFLELGEINKYLV